MATPEVKSVATRRFWNYFHNLPESVQILATKNYQLWRSDPHHPSLHFRKLRGSDDRFTVRIGEHYRAVGKLTDEKMTWIWIGTHAEYDRLVS